MYCTEFVFDGISSKEYDIFICSFDGSHSGEMTAGNHIEFTSFKAPNSNKWSKIGATYNEQLTFSFQVCKYRNGSHDIKPFSERELAFLLRWLVRKDYKWLQFIQEGYENIFYNCQLNVERYVISGQCYGLTLTANCDAPFGWSEIMSTTISSSTEKTVKLYDSSDEIGEIYPSVEIFVKGNKQDILIENLFTDKKMEIRNCIPNEHIIMKNMILNSEYIGFKKSSENHAGIMDDFNYQWLTIGNTLDNRENEIKVTGNCEVILEWRVPRKAVV
ncbi:MAG: hypothetical protein HFG38_09935 [Eubacterium sp.]|nr:hypothetical protein [Eubacterium sp.]